MLGFFLTLVEPEALAAAGLGGANEDVGACVVIVDAALPLGAADLGAAEALYVEIVLADSGAGLGADSGAGLGAAA